MAEPNRLGRLLGDPELAWPVARVRKRKSRGEPLDTTVTLSSASPAQRAAVRSGPPSRRRGNQRTPGDTDLAPAMREASIAVEQEHVLDTLLADLAG